jgi:hypothetical protein
LAHFITAEESALGLVERETTRLIRRERPSDSYRTEQNREQRERRRKRSTQRGRDTTEKTNLSLIDFIQLFGFLLRARLFLLSFLFRVSGSALNKKKKQKEEKDLQEAREVKRRRKRTWASLIIDTQRRTCHTRNGKKGSRKQYDSMRRKQVLERK